VSKIDIKKRGSVAVLSIILVSLLTVLLSTLSVPREDIVQLKLIQGDMEWTVSPVLGEESASDFYNYYSASGHTPFMESHVSKIYLYQNTETKELSLIFHQGMDNDSSGTMQAKYDFEGIPPGAYVSVSDDPEGVGNSPRSPESPEFILDLEPEAYLTNNYNSDGGVLSGLPTAEVWSITIYPEFVTGILAWKYVNSDGTEINLDMDNPVTIVLLSQSAQVSVDFDPDTLNLKSKGDWVTVYIELPDGYDVNNIDISTIMLNDVVPAELHPTEIGDYDDDGIPDLMIKFNRASVIAIVDPGDSVEIKITGALLDGTAFEGTDTIRIIGKD
jgi:hypothetical protein